MTAVSDLTPTSSRVCRREHVPGFTWRRLRIAIVGPVAPPAGGMSDQVEQLAALMRGEGADVTVVATNPPSRFAVIDRIPTIRTVGRLLRYVAALLRNVGTCDLVHVMANSGWSWHLAAAPAILLARLRGRTCIVAYHGGRAEAFLARWHRLVLPTLRAADALIVPSSFLQRVFAARGIESRVVANVVDLSLFAQSFGVVRGARRIVVARNLEPIYDMPTALKAFAVIHAHMPDTTLAIAGTGSQLDALHALAHALGLRNAVNFTGLLSRAEMADLLAGARVSLNPSTADNMPVSLLEAMASGVPIVSTNVGGIPDLVEDGRTALLVPPGDPNAMAAAILRILDEPALSARLAEAARASVERFAWSAVRPSLEFAYEHALRGRRSVRSAR